MMLIEEIKNIKSTKSELRKFGITMAIILGLLGGALLWREKDYYLYFLIVATAFLALGLFLPNLLKPIFKIWMGLATVMGWFMTRVILSVLFYLVLTPISFIARLSGKQFLDLKIDKAQASYWNHREPKKFEKVNYEKQF